MKHVYLIALILLSQSVFAQKTVDYLSFVSLKLELFNNNVLLGSATGFIIEKNGKQYLITNLHVVKGDDYYSHALTDKYQRIPNSLGIWHNGTVLGNWQRIQVNLYNNDNSKRWIECGYTDDKPFDLVALPLDNIPNTVKIFPFKWDHYSNVMMIAPGFPASIIGFPYGLSSFGRFAIWKTGHIASDMDIDADNLPVLMIDATTKPGMSGSIVVVRQLNYVTKQGSTMMGATGTSFIGIYSAQSSQEEIGYVWKPLALKMLIDKLR